MDWSQVKNYPKYNPFMFEVARHVRGFTKGDVKYSTGIATKSISDIENGNRLPTDKEVELLSKGLNFPLTFFGQWWETQLDMSGPIAKNVPIDYYKYKVFREINPTPFTIYKKPELPVEKPLAKMVSMV